MGGDQLQRDVDGDLIGPDLSICKPTPTPTNVGVSMRKTTNMIWSALKESPYPMLLCGALTAGALAAQWYFAAIALGAASVALVFVLFSRD